jgi:hypothetical protein
MKRPFLIALIAGITVTTAAWTSVDFAVVERLPDHIRADQLSRISSAVGFRVYTPASSSFTIVENRDVLIYPGPVVEYLVSSPKTNRDIIVAQKASSTRAPLFFFTDLPEPKRQNWTVREVMIGFEPSLLGLDPTGRRLNLVLTRGETTIGITLFDTTAVELITDLAHEMN